MTDPSLPVGVARLRRLHGRGAAGARTSRSEESAKSGRIQVVAVDRRRRPAVADASLSVHDDRDERILSIGSAAFGRL
jgi:hypothetical protein